MHICIAGGGSEIGIKLIDYFLSRDELVSATCRDTVPNIKHPNYVCESGIDWAQGDVPTGKSRLSELPIDAFITLMGSCHDGKIANLDMDDWKEVIDDTLTSVFGALKWAIPRMRANGGNIVVVGSVIGSMGGYGCSNYTAAKSGLLGLARAASNEYCSRGILTNLLELGYTQMGMTKSLSPKIQKMVMESIPLKRFATMEDVILAVEFLANTRYMNGGVLTLAGGLR